MITPIFIPMASIEPNRCPECKNVEKKVEVCKHCGYEYQVEKTSFLEGFIITLVILFGIWFFSTVLFWLFEAGWTKDFSLMDAIRMQGEYIEKLRVW